MIPAPSEWLAEVKSKYPDWDEARFVRIVSVTGEYFTNDYAVLEASGPCSKGGRLVVDAMTASGWNPYIMTYETTFYKCYAPGSLIDFIDPYGMVVHVSQPTLGESEWYRIAYP